MSLRCFFSGHKYPEYPPAQRIHEGIDPCGEMDVDIYCYRCECERCGQVTYHVTTLVPFQLPWNRGSYDYSPAIYRLATEDERFRFDCKPHDRVTGGIFSPCSARTAAH